MMKSSYHLLWDERGIGRNFKTGVSLHSHTQYSCESLGMIPRYTYKVPWLGQAIRNQEELYYRNQGTRLDFNRAFWTPPLHPRCAAKLERGQLERDLQVKGLVSLSDHDSIEATSLLQMIDSENFHPISVEWTIPFGKTFFHLGIHNLPMQRAADIMADLAHYTANPETPGLLAQLLDSLNQIEDVLVVLNHPLWDESGVGAAEHKILLAQLLESHKPSFHALELNGLRSWKENADVLRLAQEENMPVISGGDRHGCEPNAIVNLTNASTFAEFVSEVRYDGFSEVVFMQQYREPIRMRVLQTMLDIIREYPDHPEGRKNWNDRIFFRYPDGGVKPLVDIWKGKGPAVVKQFLWLLCLVENRRVRSALRLALNEREEFVFER